MALKRPSWTACPYFPEGCRPALWQKIWHRGPREALNLSQALSTKAETQNDQLSDDERARFLARGDLAAKALANPDTLTQAERYEIMGWIPLEPLHQTIRDATGGQMSTPKELLDKVRQTSSFDSLTVDALELLIQGFRPVSALGAPELFLDIPGNKEARRLIQAREGVDEDTENLYGRAMAYCSTDPKVRAERRAKFEAAEANGEKGLLVQLAEPFGCLSMQDYLKRVQEEAMSQALAAGSEQPAPPSHPAEP
ncbi:uncharacterized protein PG986_014627 [Apiospora aurea]|uniref:Uncharacterized protein n=1 Tax=Apiospora aurea TaxID=335848 RepID=A0ABR1PTI2_9PEZI